MEEGLIENEWTWCAHKNSHSENYESTYVELAKFDTLQEFWKYKHWIPSIKTIYDEQLYIKNQRIIGYSMFKNNMRPLWEDYKRSCELSCRQSMTKEVAGSFWDELLFGLLGNALPMLIGIRFVCKYSRYSKTQKFELWMTDESLDVINELKKMILIVAPTLEFTLTEHSTKQKICKSKRSR